MINSRSLEDLLPAVRAKAKDFLAACSAQGIDVLVTSTYRDNESQDQLYAQGRTKPGKVVTKARGGQSWHNYKCAFDVVPLRNGKPVWESTDPVWQVIGKIGESCGLEWAGRWLNFREFPHFQYTGGHTLAELASGKVTIT